jgi:hypothetical protein
VKANQRVEVCNDGGARDGAYKGTSGYDGTRNVLTGSDDGLDGGDGLIQVGQSDADGD